VADIIAARVLLEAAHGHVFDHARPQWADGPRCSIGGHRSASPGLKVAGPSMLGIGCPDRHALPHLNPSKTTPTATSAPSRASGFVHREGFRMPARDRPVQPWRGPASESLRRRNPRESGEDLPVYGDLAGRRLCRGMILARSLRAESRVRVWIDRC
jgi:hypothetical protein